MRILFKEKTKDLKMQDNKMHDTKYNNRESNL